MTRPVSPGEAVVQSGGWLFLDLGASHPVSVVLFECVVGGPLQHTGILLWSGPSPSGPCIIPKPRILITV